VLQTDVEDLDSLAEMARECSALTFAAFSWSSQKPPPDIRPSSSATRSLSAAGSKVVREQRHLRADRSKALRDTLGGGSGGHRAQDRAGVAGRGNRSDASGLVAFCMHHMQNAPRPATSEPGGVDDACAARR